jgi:hypothetical protein
MRLKTLLVSAVALASFGAFGAAHASTTFFSTFENVPGGPSAGGYTTVSMADGWTGGGYLGVDNNGIELQNNAAGAPAPDGGSVFVELDTYANSSMSRTITAGAYDLSFLYSPRPGNPASSNGIQLLLDGVLVTPPGTVTADGGGSTSWSTVTANFTVTGDTTLTFAAVGTSDSYGGYVDNISLTPVPEPGVWTLMLAGVGMVGVMLRVQKRRLAVAA